MAKFTYDDKMHIQTLHEQGYGAKRIKKAYPHKQWPLSIIKLIYQRIEERGSATDRKVGSGRPKSVRTATNIAAVEELICSQENQPETSRSTRQIARELRI